MIFDTHAHLDDNAYEDDLKNVIQKIKDENIKYIVNPGCDFKTSKKAIMLSNEYDFIYSAVGYHPNDVLNADIKILDKIKNLAETNDKVVAIGEIGLDYHYDGYDKNKQYEFFIAQIELARDLNLPIIIHSRDASEDTYNILKEHKKTVKSVLHCYSQSKEMAKKYLDLGCYMSFGGSITFKNAKGLLDVVKYIPLDRIFLETDSPYLTPQPFRGKRNSPIYVKLVAKKLSELKNISINEIYSQTFSNATNFFDI